MQHITLARLARGAVRFVAVWLLAGTIIAVVLGPGVGIATGLVMAIGYVWLLATVRRTDYAPRDAAVSGSRRQSASGSRPLT
jgi:hypothetical protein